MKYLILLTLLLLTSCRGVEGKYVNDNDELSTNYLEIKNNGTYFHYYKKDTIELSQKGTWKKSYENESIIEFNDWKSYNERGKDYENYGVYLLFVDGENLNNGPDGTTPTGFKKENNIIK